MAVCYPQFDNGNPWLRPQQPKQPLLFPDGGGSTTTTTPRPTTQSPRFYACLQSCPATSEYNPICGSDSVNYYNENKFNCAINCGLSEKFDKISIPFPIVKLYLPSLQISSSCIGEFVRPILNSRSSRASSSCFTYVYITFLNPTSDR